MAEIYPCYVKLKKICLNTQEFHHWKFDNNFHSHAAYWQCAMPPSMDIHAVYLLFSVYRPERVLKITSQKAQLNAPLSHWTA